MMHEMSQNAENAATIRRLQKETMGDPEDGVEMLAKCNVMNFKVSKNEVVGIGSQHIANCKLLASFDNGVVSISIRDGRPFMVSVRLDELMALLKEAADYHNENYQKQQEAKGPESLPE